MNLSPQMMIKQQQKLNQNQIQSLQVLTLDNCELNEFLQTEYAENPLLDCSYNSGISVSWHRTIRQESPDFDSSQLPANDSNAVINFFLEQLDPYLFSTKEWNTCKFLILLLDEHGFFPYTPKDLYKMFQLPIDVTTFCLTHLRTLKPSGVFQPDLCSYFLYQLRELHLDSPDMTTLIRHHLDDIANGNLKKIALHLHTDIPSVRKFIRCLKELSPRPFFDTVADTAIYITPDILANKTEQRWTFALNDHWIGNYSLNDYYVKMMQQSTDLNLKDYFRQKYERGRLIIQSIEQRRATILNICESIVSRQKNYFEFHGPLVPMTLSDIASDLGIAVSTVSRGIKNKYLQHPNGIVLLKDLFNSGLQQSSNTNLSTASILHMISEIIAAEDKHKPLSDHKIMDCLTQKGIQISRRTVTKYRIACGIPSTIERKKGESQRM